MLSNRYLLSLLAGLFLSTLASANSADVTTPYLHSGANNSANHVDYFPTISEKTSPTMFVAQIGHTSTGAIGNTDISAMISGKPTNGGGITAREAGTFVFPKQSYGPICCGARPWIGSGRDIVSLGSGSKPGLSTPEPGSLMLLSTGLIGIGGMVKRKLRLG